ncbi:hypothetical protein QAD02_005074 [Eretmocerus hayati]|uniref:Uncharacterized protein n=1 Tax=Eretmocerus hayati TaxID=131215 RepID=A0ACC2NU96_9HYME|nr:hypothetical protein QAD02_005074 [Eretmocerus hayati]
MGKKSKRRYSSSDDDEEKLMEQLRKFVSKKRRKRHHRRHRSSTESSCSSSSSENNSYGSSSDNDKVDGHDSHKDQSVRSISVPSISQQDAGLGAGNSQQPDLPAQIGTVQATNVDQHNNALDAALECNGGPKEINLSEDILNVIGHRLTEERVFAAPVHSDFASRWADIVKLGLPAEEKEKLVKSHPTPKNCTFADPPKMNIEVLRTFNEAARSRDDKIVQRHGKLTACLASIGETLSVLTSRGSSDDTPIIGALSDACRLIADTIYDESMIRRGLALSNVSSTMKEALSETTPDEYLFGSNLPDTLKAAKLIEQSAEDLRASKPAAKTPKNSKGPSRQNKSQTAKTTSGPRTRSYPNRKPHSSERSEKSQNNSHSSQSNNHSSSSRRSHRSDRKHQPRRN